MADTIVRSKSVCFTGHRVLNSIGITVRLDNIVEQLIQSGYQYFYVGGAVGFDTLAAFAVLRAQDSHPEVKLIITAPFAGQEDRWSDSDKSIYNTIKTRANVVVYVSQVYSKSCYFERNRYMVDRSALCVAYIYKKSGGTAYTVNYAKEQGLKVINLYKNKSK